MVSYALYKVDVVMFHYLPSAEHLTSLCKNDDGESY